LVGLRPVKAARSEEDTEVAARNTADAAVAIYARISEDRADGAGVDRQLADCRALVKRNGWGKAQEYTDNNFSAFSGKVRPAYAQMLEATKAGIIGRIVVYNIDRLYRQPKELEVLIDLADRGQLSVVTCQGDMNLSTDDGITMARVLVAMANKASRDTSRRVKRAKAEARKNGRPMGGPRAFGWKDTLRPEPKEAALLGKAANDLLAGVSLNEVARRWNAAEVKQPQTGRAAWTADGIRQLFANPRHAGLVGHRVHEGGNHFSRPVVLGKAAWPAIIDHDRWERLQAVLMQRGAAGRVPRRRSLLTGLVHCGQCGRTMVRGGGRAGGTKIRKVWRCPTTTYGNRTQPVKKGCGRVSIDAGGLEQLLTLATLKLADTSRFAAIVAQQSHQSHGAARLVGQLDALGQRLNAAAISYAKGKLGVAAFEKAQSLILQEQRDVQKRLGQFSTSGVLAPFAGRPGFLRKRWDEMTEDQRRTIIGLALGKVTVAPAIKHGRPSFDPARVSIQRAA
jgi:DNA invertase Pin-like site-specific DNA recombinase